MKNSQRFIKNSQIELMQMMTKIESQLAMMNMVKEIHQNVQEMKNSIAKLQNKMQDKKEGVMDFSGNITNSFGSCGSDNMEREESTTDSHQAEVKYSLKCDEQTLAKYEKNDNDKIGLQERALPFSLSANSSRYLIEKEKEEFRLSYLPIGAATSLKK